MTSGQPTLRDLYAGYPTDDEAAAFGGVRYLAPRGYVALFSDGEIWDVAGFDYRGNPLIRVRGGALVRANAYPAYVAQGFEELLARSA